MVKWFETIWKLLNDNQLFFGILLGWLFARLWEEVRKPNIKLEIGGDGFWPQNTTPKTKFVHIKIINQKRNLLRALFLSNPTANNARAWISFLDYLTHTEVFKMNGRWASKREPVDYTTGKVDLAEVLLPSRETIPSGEETNISIAIKDDGKSSCFGFNNESYIHNWRNPDYELIDKRYIVKVRISAEGKEWTKNFLLHNPGNSLKNFRLVEVNNKQQ